MKKLLQLHPCAFLLFTAIVALPGVARAEPITYEMTVNTSALFGEAGGLEFALNPGVSPFDPATAAIDGFVSDGTLTGAEPDLGDVTGTLPGEVLINNTDFQNDHLEDFTFGSFFDVFVTLDIPIVSGNAVGGSSFVFYLLDNTNSPVTGGPIVEVDLNTDGSQTITNNLPTDTNFSQVPEPTTLLLVGSGLLGLLRRRSRG
jgi:hypothetical protein